MTKEHRLAIRMWEGILHNLPEWHKDRHTMPVKLRVSGYKAMFTKFNHLGWDASNCWLCTYIHYWRHPERLCRTHCLLVSCTHVNSLYHIVIANNSSLFARKRACKQIINVLKKGARPKTKALKKGARLKIKVMFEV